MILLGMTERGATPRHLRRHMRRILKEAWEETAIHWHRHMLPKHFTQQGAREYRYTPRKGERGGGGKSFRRSYTGRKLAAKGHTRPLVYSGLTRFSTRLRQITSTSKGARVRLNVPAYIRWRLRHSKIDMADELTRVTAAEEAELTRVLEGAIQRRIDGIADVTLTRAA
jgi:hypothetical protein